MKRAYKLFVLAGAAFLLTANFAGAAELLAPKSEDGAVTIGAAEAHRNLYAGASTITSNGNIFGDAFLGGGTVNINGNVEQDLFAAGGTLILNGIVGGDLRTAGGTLTINGPVGGDALAAGGTLALTEKATVAGDLLAAGGTVDIHGPVAGSARIAGGTIFINSKIGGNVYVKADKSLTFGSKAQVAGKVYYTGPNEAVLEQGAQVSSIEYTKAKARSRGTGAWKAFFTGGLLIKLLAWIIAVLLLIKLVPAKTHRALEIAHNRPWASLGIGFLALVVTPLAVIILFLTLVGYYAAVLVLALYVTTLLFSCLVGALFLGNLIMKWLMKKPGPLLDWQTAVIGVTVSILLGFIPVLGWLVMAILSLIGFGSLVQLIKREAHQ